jgi:hypothetical protein
MVWSVSSYSEFVNRVSVARDFIWKSKAWSFWCPLDGCKGRHRLAYNGLQLPEGREFENEISLKE